MKIISAHQPAYIPWLGYFHKILLSDEFIIMDDVQFEKNSFINRNQIIQNKNKVWLTIPVITKDYKTKTIKDITVSDQKWKRKHLMTLEQAYKKTQFFHEVFPIVETGLKVESDFLVDYTHSFLFQVLDYLNITTPIKFSSDLSIEAKKLGYILELTKKLEGDLFVFGKQGRAYADNEILSTEGIKPYYQDYKHPDYIQKTLDFIPYMSVFDLMFNHGKDALSIIQLQNSAKADLK